jgi:hypothetical protein
MAVFDLIQFINLASAEIYDPGWVLWSATGSLATARYGPTATLLAGGKVLLAGGYAPLASGELYDVGLGSNSDWQPVIANALSILTKGHRHLRPHRSRFQGISQASGGNTQDSSTNIPVVQLR